MEEEILNELKSIRKEMSEIGLQLKNHLEDHIDSVDINKLVKIRDELKKKKKLTVHEVMALLHISKPMALRYMKETEQNQNVVFCLGKPGPNNCSRLLLIEGEGHFTRMIKEVISEMLSDPDPDCTKIVGPTLEFYHFETMKDEDVVSFIQSITTSSRGRIIAVYPKLMNSMIDVKRIRQTKLLKVG